LGEKLEQLKELKTKFVAFQGNLPLFKLLEELRKAFKEKTGEELMIPITVFSYGKNMVVVFYASPEDYKKGKAILLSDKSENVKEFYSIFSKILIHQKE